MSEFDEVADELYALRPEEFAAARDAQVKQARTDGKAALAKEIAGLRKPTLSAWLVNLLWRDQQEVMEQLFELSNELQRAQQHAAGQQLRELTTQRRHLENALMQQAIGLAKQAGVNVNDSVAREAQDTLSAALANPEVADEVRTGRLVKAASYAGFGVLPSSTTAPRPAQAQAVTKEPIDLTAEKRAREEARRAEAEQRVERARADVQSATAALGDASRAADAAAQRGNELRDQRDELRDQLRRAESELERTERATAAAEKEREQAKKRHAAALAALETAERALDEF